MFWLHYCTDTMTLDNLVIGNCSCIQCMGSVQDIVHYTPPPLAGLDEYLCGGSLNRVG